MGTAIANTTGNPVMATVQSAGSYEAGGPAIILIDGADTTCTANGLAGYTPSTGDRLLVQRVQSVMTIISLVSAALYAPTLTGSLIQTAASGLRMWMSGQPGIVEEAGQIDLNFGSGLSTENSPASIGLLWNADVATLHSAMSTGAPITSITVNSVSVSYVIPAGTVLQVYYYGTSKNAARSQLWTTTAPVTIPTSGTVAIPVASQTPNYAYPVNAPVSVLGAEPDNTTGTVAVAMFGPVFSDTPNHITPPSFYIAQNTGHGLSGGVAGDNYAYLTTDAFYVAPTSGGAQQLGVDGNGVLIGNTSGSFIHGFDFDQVTGIGALAANGGSTTIHVTFPVAYASPPNVVASVNGQRIQVNVQSVTTTGFDFVVTNWTSSATAGGNDGWWIAIG